MSQQKEIHMDKLQELKERVEFLEKENEYLKSLLDKAGITYASTDHKPIDLYEPDQGARIIHRDARYVWIWRQRILDGITRANEKKWFRDESSGGLLSALLHS